MRYRCDGVLYEMVPPPRHLANAIASRIKVMANLDIAERRLPQDGRIELNVGGNPVDLRVSVLPTMFGESVVIRVLDRTVTSASTSTSVGMEPSMLAAVPRADPQAQRHRPRHRADRLRQDDHALLGPQRAERDHRQDHHHRRPGRVRHRRHHPGADQPRHRPDVRRRPAGDPAAGPGHHPGRRDPRPGDGPDRRAGVADRPPGLQHAAHQRRPEHHHPPARHGPGAVPASPPRSKAILAQRLVRKICEDCRTEFEPEPTKC